LAYDYIPRRAKTEIGQTRAALQEIKKFKFQEERDAIMKRYTTKRKAREGFPMPILQGFEEGLKQ
jgi:hypothetical protein